MKVSGKLYTHATVTRLTANLSAWVLLENIMQIIKICLKCYIV